ncbi:RpiB/LacA/LacB family sugar-phosphate isomerase [Sunxiuqinia sp. A32]|uniref:RpiB/LacA/LacB family sugar-phosphate isomerase n=1 Tax=Sunxiuqinia sp. A32 TaxID=3461496 RepID=UPI004045FF90
MRIAVVNEFSTVDKNKDVVGALNELGYEVLNAGMKNADEPVLSYLETSIISAILIELKVVDLVVGGCGTGQGYFNAVMQFPGVFCGLILDPVDAWLFAQVNAGNVISLSLNKGYALGGNINIKFILEKLFSVEAGAGYPEHRKQPQKEAREALARLSEKTHLPFDKIIEGIDESILKKVLLFPGLWEIIENAPDEKSSVKAALTKRYNEFQH